MESIRKFVEDFRASGKKLNVLVNNAGLSLNFKDNKRQYTKDNFELTIGVNHLGNEMSSWMDFYVLFWIFGNVCVDVNKCLMIIRNIVLFPKNSN